MYLFIFKINVFIFFPISSWESSGSSDLFYIVFSTEMTWLEIQECPGQEITSSPDLAEHHVSTTNTHTLISSPVTTLGWATNSVFHLVQSQFDDFKAIVYDQTVCISLINSGIHLDGCLFILYSWAQEKKSMLFQLLQVKYRVFILHKTKKLDNLFYVSFLASYVTCVTCVLLFVESQGRALLSLVE